MLSPDHLTHQFSRTIAATGPITIQHYMAEANATYYAGRDPLGIDGDFITAPEISQIFGELIGLWLTDIWVRADSPPLAHYVELGPGRGTLARDARSAMEKFRFTPSLHMVETSPALRTKQRGLLGTGHWHDRVDTLPENGPLFIVANEFFDVLPIRQMIATHDGWRERVVVRDGPRFMAIPGARPMDAVVPKHLANSPPGTIVESCAAAAEMAFEISRRLTRQGGVMLAIDYGYTEPQSGSTLQAVHAHKKADPFVSPGNSDLTAHVNFAELAAVGAAAKVAVYGPVEQGAWLRALGIHPRAEQLSKAAPDEAADVATAVARLVEPQEMGSLFKVIAYIAPEWPAPAGF